MKQHLTFIIYAAVLIVIQFLVTSHLFVTYAEMTDYAVSKEAYQQILKQLDRIEHKVDKVIIGY